CFRSTCPLEIMATYVRETIRLAAQGAHRPAAALRAAELPPECLSRLEELHHEQVAPFRSALLALDVPDPMITGQLLGGVVESAMAAVEAGADRDAVTRRFLDLLRAAVRPPVA